MTPQFWLLSLGAWIAGVVAWSVAAGFAYAQQVRWIEATHQRYLGACEKDADYKNELGDVRNAAEEQEGGAASFKKALLATYTHPLLVCLITSLASFLATEPKDVTLPILGWIVGVGAVLTATIIDASGSDSTRSAKICAPMWIGALLLFFWLADSATPTEDSESKKDESSLPSDAVSPSTQGQPLPPKAPSAPQPASRLPASSADTKR